jgi:hypothetical protein
MGVYVIDQLLNNLLTFVRYYRNWEYKETIHQLLIDFKKAYNSVRREVMQNILVRLIKICLNETYSKVSIGKHLSDTVCLLFKMI